MKRGSRSIAASFRSALRGIRDGIAAQRNLRIQLVCAGMAVVLGLWLRLPWRDWAVLALTIAAVLASELMNTAVEATVDLACPVICDGARRAKDLAAGATLTVSIGAALVGLFLFLPRFVSLCLH